MHLSPALIVEMPGGFGHDARQGHRGNALAEIDLPGRTRDGMADGRQLAFVDEFPVRGRTSGIKVWTLVQKP